MSTNIIKLNRGDSFEFSIVVPDSKIPSKVHLLTADEAVYFAIVYPNQRFEDAVLVKGYDFRDQNINNGEIVIKLVPNDTRSLAPGIYYYLVKFQKGGTLDVIDDYDEPDEVYTIIERTKFIINE